MLPTSNHIVNFIRKQHLCEVIVGQILPIICGNDWNQAITTIQLKLPLLKHNFHLVAHILPAMLRETAVFRKACVLPGLRPHQHLRQAAAGEFAGILAHHIENSLLQRI